MGDLRTDSIVAAAVVAIVVPLVFVVVIVIAGVARRRGGVFGTTAHAVIAFTGGAAVGALLLIGADDLNTSAPLLLVAVLVAAFEWRAGRPWSAGWLVVGVALPWTLLWSAYLVLVLRGVDFDRFEVARGLAAGALPLAAGLVLAGRFSPDRMAQHATPPGPPRRSFRMIAAAIAEPNRIGPFGLPELAAVASWVVVGLAAAFIPVGSSLVRLVLVAIVGSALASEAYLRAMAPLSRRAFEAFSWVGEQDLATLYRLTGLRRPPITIPGARSWLERHPVVADEPPLLRSLRIEMLLLAGRVDAARTAATDRPAPADPEEAFGQAADRQLVAWWADEPEAHAGLAALEHDASQVTPADGDARLRAEVSVAIARVRERVADGLPNPAQPLADVRARLGPRADGILRRTLWRRLFGVFVAWSLGLGLLGLVTGVLPPP